MHSAERPGAGADRGVGTPGVVPPPRSRSADLPDQRPAPRPAASRPASPDGPAAQPPDEQAPAGAVDLSAAVQAAQAGDEEAFRQLFRAVQPGLLRYLRVLVGGRPGDTQDAEDIASEAWLQIARDLHTFSGDADGFRGWAATVARNRALDHLRSRRRRPIADLPLEYLAELASGDDTAGTALATVGTSDALALISRLPRDQAEAVLLRVVMQLDAESAARVLGKRAGTVRMAAHRGLRGLAKLLERTGAAEAGIPHRRAPQKRPQQGVTEPRAATLKDVR
ncbi:RNA polymerase sigma factor [Kitasatospora sp. NPDC057015]|uniref:RNA polymerase sigma factor n=1 Tax=Kitasatospora sp. NPDC057015 TaxID=3346001 RepID=UPI0036412A1C